VKITEAECDPDLGTKLKAELPGILAWAVEGCLAWQAEGLKKPQVLLDAVAEYRAEMDIVSAFLDSETELAEEERVTSTQLYQRFVTWCGQNAKEPMKTADFNMRMKARGTVEARVGSTRTRGWKGIRLRNHAAVALRRVA